jgi:peptide/nickel transport system substrate-binding protein
MRAAGDASAAGRGGEVRPMRRSGEPRRPSRPRSGRRFHRCLPATLAAAALIAASCGGSSSPALSGSAPSAPVASLVPSAGASSASPSPSTAPSASLAAGGAAALFDTTYRPPTGVTPGGVLVIGNNQPLDSLNPFYTTSLATIVAITPALRGFVTITSDGKYIPDLADHIPTIANGDVVISGTTFTVKVTLRPNLDWSDGTPLTMNDFKATWAWANDPAQAGCTGCAVGWNEIDRVDVDPTGLSATLHFNELYAGWLSFLAGPVLLESKWLETFKVADGSKSMPLSSAITSVPFDGPFVITNASKTEIDYARNPEWHAGVDLAVGGQAHPAYLDSLKLVYFDTKDGEIDAFKSGAIDLALGLNQGDYSAVQSTDPSVGTAELTPVWQYEHFDLNNDPTHARGSGLWLPAVRKAIAMAVDKPDLIAADFPGQSVPVACSPVPPGLWYRKEETCAPFDVAAANALLDSAGLDKGSDGDRSLGGKEIDLELCTTTGNPTRLIELQKLDGYLATIGLKSHVVTVDANSVLYAGWDDTKPTTDCSIYRGTYDIADFAYILGSDPYGNYFYTYSSTQFPELADHSGTNDTRFSDPTMDAALNTLGSDVDLDQQFGDAGMVQDVYTRGIPEIPLYYSSNTVGVGVRMGGWPGNNPSSIGPTWNPEDWYVK